MVPEPSTVWAAVVAGVGALALWRRERAKEFEK
jgi:MYXO-CTERM domain-containing protein